MWFQNFDLSSYNILQHCYQTPIPIRERQGDICWLVVDQPLWKIWKSMVGELSHVLWKIKAMFETTNQYIYIYLYTHKMFVVKQNHHKNWGSNWKTRLDPRVNGWKGHVNPETMVSFYSKTHFNPKFLKVNEFCILPLVYGYRATPGRCQRSKGPGPVPWDRSWDRTRRWVED